MRKFLSLFLLSCMMIACAEMQTVLDQYQTDTYRPLTNGEVSSGLKEALKIGSSNAANILSLKDGFYKDELVKILLPPEAQKISKNISMIPGGKDLIDKLELRLNRAAEDAVKEAAPIFVSAISEMSIADAFAILKGNDNAATQYLKDKTYSKLSNRFLPKVKSSLDKKLVANLSTNESWNLLTTNYNKVANSFAGKIAQLTPVSSQLDEYVTHKALDALFLKVAGEEKQIRKNPLKRVNNLLKRVFGELDK